MFCVIRWLSKCAFRWSDCMDARNSSCWKMNPLHVSVKIKTLSDFYSCQKEWQKLQNFSKVNDRSLLIILLSTKLSNSWLNGIRRQGSWNFFVQQQNWPSVRKFFFKQLSEAVIVVKKYCSSILSKRLFQLFHVAFYFAILGLSCQRSESFLQKINTDFYSTQ